MQSAHGIRGELFIRLNAGRADWLDNAETLSLLPKNSKELIPLTIVKLKAHKDGLIGSFKEIGDRNRAEELAKSSVYIPQSLLESEPGEPVYLDQISGFEVVDPSGTVLGRIEGFATNGPQDLLQLRTPEGREALVPLIDEFLVHIDFDKQQVTMDLPPGLINLEEE